MSNYSSSSSLEDRERSRKPHPIWRGIGFMMLVIGPIVAFALSDLLVQYARTRKIAMPLELQTDPINIPIYGPVTDLYAVLVLAGAITLIIFALFAIINAAVYQASGKSTYQAFESEPKRFKKKRKVYKQ